MSMKNLLRSSQIAEDDEQLSDDDVLGDLGHASPVGELKKSNTLPVLKRVVSEGSALAPMKPLSRAHSQGFNQKSEPDAELLAEAVADHKSIVPREGAYLCFDSIHSHLYNTVAPESRVPDGTAGIVVKWFRWYEELSGPELKLRGRFGNFNPVDQVDGLAKCSVVSAFKDRHQDPIGKKELPKLVCHVCLLEPLERPEFHLDWELGVHGLTVEFKELPRRSFIAKATPDELMKMGTNKEDVLENFIRSTGFDGDITERLRRTASWRRFRVKSTSVTYPEYEQHRRSTKTWVWPVAEDGTIMDGSVDDTSGRIAMGGAPGSGKLQRNNSAMPIKGTMVGGRGGGGLASLI